MVLKEDGTKWACISCLKGHRVSSCNHTDRPLQFVPRKGRPLSQCQHCRSERRKRSHHVKCGCGDKDKASKRCPHRDGKDAHHSDGEHHDLGPLPEGEESDEHTCCCHHGESCTCSSIKKDGNNHGADHGNSGRAIKSKPRLTTTASDGHLTILPNGHHKALSRISNAGHGTDSPYRIHKPHPAHGLHAAGRRSMDSLATLDKTAKSQPLLQTRPPTSSSSDSLNTQLPLINEPLESDSYNAFAIPIDPFPNETFDPLPSGQGNQTADRSKAGFEQPSFSGDYGDLLPSLDWNLMVDAQNVQPALTNASTYASSNAFSDFGEYTPPDEMNSIFGAQNTMQPNLDPGNQNYANFQIDGQQQRWSLPPSFWGGDRQMASYDFSVPPDQQKTSGGARVPAQADRVSTLRTNNIAISPEFMASLNTPQPKCEMGMPLMSNSTYVAAQGQATRPVPSYTQSESNLSRPMSSNGTFDGSQQDPNGMVFDFSTDFDQSSNMTSMPQQNPTPREDPFFGSDLATDSFDFGGDMSMNGMGQNWAS